MSTTLDVPTRASLVLAFRDPDNKKAQVAFTECYAPLLRNWCRRYRLQEADQHDVVQTILCRLFEWLPTFQYDPSKSFRGYLRGMIHNAIMDIHRQRQRHPAGYGSGDTGILGQLHEMPAPDDPAIEDLTRELAGQMERDKQVQEACERVRERVRPHTWQAFWLTTVEGKSGPEVAELLQISKGAVYVAKSHVIKLIKEELEHTPDIDSSGSP
jgi:RNA polymerase sigma-70 factor (ECF subfamily)